jgi:MerR family transcriptional regulator/heat shock protein HspR
VPARGDGLVPFLGPFSLPLIHTLGRIVYHNAGALLGGGALRFVAPTIPRPSAGVVDFRQMTKRKSKGAYMISAVAEMYGIHPQTLRLYEREGLLKPSRTEGNTRLYTDEDLQRLEFILTLARDLAVNISGIAIILQMRERMEEMQRQIQDFVKYIQEEMLARATAAADPSRGAIVPVRRAMVTQPQPTNRKK